MNNFGLTHTGAPGYTPFEKGYDFYGQNGNCPSSPTPSSPTQKCTQVVYRKSTNSGSTWTNWRTDSFQALNPIAYTAQATIALPNGTLIRRVNGDDLKDQAGIPHTAMLQALVPSGGTYPASWPALGGSGQVVITDPSICKYQISRIRALKDGSGRYIAMGQAWRYASGGTSGACATSATALSGTGIRLLLLVAASATAVQQGNWTLGMPYVSANTLFPNEWDAAQLPNGDLLAMFRTTVSGANVRRQALIRAQPGGSPNPWILDAATIGNPANFPHSGHPDLLATQGVVISFATTGVSYTGNGGQSWTTLSGHTGASNYYPTSVQDAAGTIYVFGHVGCDDPYSGYESTNYTGTPTGVGCWQNTPVNKTIKMQKLNIVCDTGCGTPPAVVTNPATSVGSTTATLNGTVDPNGTATTYYYEYGTTTSYGSVTSTQSAGSGTNPVSVPVNISGLNAGTLYHFRLIANGVVNGIDRTFTTTGTPPAVVTNPASSIGSTTATLNGTVDPNGTATNYYYQYGPTTSYGSFTTTQSAGSGGSPVSVPVSVSGLSAGTLYHFRLVANGTVNGIDRTFTTLSGSSYSDTVLADNPISYWRLGESSGTTATDEVGLNPGTYTGGVTLGVSGAVPGDTAASFDGVNDYVLAPDDNTLDGGDVFTVEAWIKPSLLGVTNTIVNKFGSYFLYLDGTNKLVLYKPSNGTIAFSTATISDTTNYHYVAVTKNGSDVHIYLDGVDVTGTVTNRTVVNTTGGFYIGYLGGSPFHGAIDEVAFYNTALSSSTIANHYAARNQ